METKRKWMKHAEYGYPVINSISSAAQGSRNQCVEHRNHTMTAQVTGKCTFNGYVPDN